MDYESALVSKALSSGELPLVVARGIEPDHFADEDVRDVFEYALDFMTIHKQPPSIGAVKQEFPGFKPPLSRDPISWHLDKFIRQVKERKAVELVRAYHEALEDPDEIDEIELRALEMARELTEVVPAPRASRFSDGMVRKHEYERRKREGILHGVLLGIPTFDELMLGIQPHELMVVAAYLGTGKTTLMQHMAMSSYLQGKTSLFISLEVEAEQILRKFDVMLSNIRYHALKALELNVGEEKAWVRILEAAEADRLERDIIIRDDIKNCTVEKVLAETIRYKPSIVFVDYLELMRVPRGLSNSHWEAVSHSGTGLKQNARVLKIPHITAAQLNRDGGKGEVTLATVGYQSIGKHCDSMIGMQQDEELEARNKMKLLLLKHRDGPSRKSVLMRWDLERGIIREEGVEDRFVTRKRHSLSSRERRREQQLEIAEMVADRPNPFAQRRKKPVRRNRRKAQPTTRKAKRHATRAKAA